jgi:hypothetical protein
LSQPAVNSTIDPIATGRALLERDPGAAGHG